MSWLPTFGNILPAAIAAALAVPALLVLYFLKLKRREMPVSSTLLWKKAIQDLQVNAPFQKLRRNLLLFLQLLLLLLLTLALSRPIVNYSPGAGKMTVILIDRSASMSSKDIDDGKTTRLDEAKRRAKKLADTMDRGASAMVIAFDDSAETVQPFTTDASAVKRAIDSIQPTDRRTRLKLAYQLAEAQSNFNPEQLRSTQKPDVWVYSDGRVLDGPELRLNGTVHYDKVGTDTAGNVAIVALSAKRNYENPLEVQVFARLANYGPNPVSPDVQLTVDGQVMKVATTTLLPERWTDKDREQAEKQAGMVPRDSVEFTIELANSAVIKVEQMRKDGDCLAADDAASIVVPAPKTLQVLLVTDGNYFLEKALDSLNLKSPDRMLPTVYEEKLPTQYHVIIFDRYQPKKLPPSGSFIYFGVVPNGLKLSAVRNGDQPVMMQDQGVLDWKRDHPILRYLNLGKIYVGEAIKLSVPPDAETLVDGLKGPLVVLYREGRNTHLLVAFDLLQSNWPLQVSFPMFMYQALQFLAMGSDMDVRQSFEPGATPRLPRATLVQADPNIRSVRLNGPGASRDITVPPAGDFALPPLDKVGVYTTDPPVPQYEKIAVNLLDPSESNLLPSAVPPGQVGDVVQSKGKGRLELWWWIVAFVALPLLLIEWWVYTRRVHL